VERTTTSRVQPELGLRDAIAELIGGAPEGPLRDAAAAACAGVEDALGPLIAADAGDGGGRAALPAALLEGAERAEGTVSGLGDRAPHERMARIEDNRAAALAAAWLRARAVELASALGDAPLRSATEAVARIADGQMLEAEDLYDAGRTPERCIAALESTRGGLGSFAALSAAMERGAAAQDAEALASIGSRIATAARISDDARSLVPELVPAPVRAGEAMTRGLYTLPVAYALEEDSTLAGSLAGAVRDDALAGLVEGVRATGALSRCAVTCRRLTRDAGPLSRLGDEIAEACEEATRA
jgi:geranylgeranyl pyrophosphate synthase